MEGGHVPVAQLDKASDYESEDWGFESLQGLTFFVFGGGRTPQRPSPDRAALPHRFPGWISGACSVMVIIGASQALDPGSIPGRRTADLLGH